MLKWAWPRSLHSRAKVYGHIKAGDSSLSSSSPDGSRRRSEYIGSKGLEINNTIHRSTNNVQIGDKGQC